MKNVSRVIEKPLEEKMSEELKEFRLPTYKEIPSVGLYLDQVSKYINDSLAVIPECTVTNSMISNYVKKKLVPNPVKKQYGRDQIAYLIFIALSKRVLSLDDVAALFRIQKLTCSCEEAYTFFAGLFEDSLRRMFRNQQPDNVKEKDKNKALLKNIVITIVHSIYLTELLKDTEG